jgi:hypothetical protein
MKSIAENSDLHKFLSFVLLKISENEMEGINKIGFSEDNHAEWFEKEGLKEKVTKYNYWYEKLKDYEITDAWISENFTYYVHIEINIRYKWNRDVLSDESFLILNSNLGIFTIFPDENGCINRMELNFRIENLPPPFVLDLNQTFPNRKDPQADILITRQVEDIGTFDMETALRDFKQKQINVVEVD